jgi:phage host-nuclease inhibitor protein Gam
MRYILTSANVRYHVKSGCIREGEGSIINSRIKVVNELREKQKSHYGTNGKQKVLSVISGKIDWKLYWPVPFLKIPDTC